MTASPVLARLATLSLAFVGTAIFVVSLVASNAEADPAPAVAANPPSAPLVVTKTVQRNVYDGLVKVGELTYTMRKVTTSPTTYDYVEILPPVFEVTNTVYMSNVSPLPTIEIIDIYGSETQQEGVDSSDSMSTGDMRTNDGDEGNPFGGDFPPSSWWDDIGLESDHEWRDEQFFELPTADNSYSVRWHFYDSTGTYNGKDWDDVFADPDADHTCILNYYNADYYGTITDKDILKLEVKEEF